MGEQGRKEIRVRIDRPPKHLDDGTYPRLFLSSYRASPESIAQLVLLQHVVRAAPESATTWVTTWVTTTTWVKGAGPRPPPADPGPGRRSEDMRASLG